ncbi:hypothetical protein E2C01_045946 [Portunus trituberculatus]|uniref:Uncharacterized protein n=1 Tax=Portunus trituberculatus TaxID=210409 RepID=A0A5B7G2R0_PORTR|nr:hypothetical protein [Portunus trituberculatus]
MMPQEKYFIVPLTPSVLGRIFTTSFRVRLDGFIDI